MKKLMCLLFVLLFSASMAACGAGEPKTDEITLWAGEQWIGSDYAHLEQFIDYYNETASEELGFTVKLSPKSDFAISLQGAITRGNAPDLITWGRFNTPTYVRRGYIDSIQDLIDRDGIDTDELFYAEANNELIFEGEQYGIALDLDVWGIYVNNKILDGYNATDAGKADPAVLPTTWTELIDSAKKLRSYNSKGNMTVAGYSTIDLPDFYFPYLTSTGETMIGEDGYVKFDTPKSRATLQHLKNLYDENLCVAGLDTKSSFANGMLAMINQSVYFSSYLDENYPDLEYTFIPLPAYDGELGGGDNAGMLGGFSLAIPRQQEKFIDDAWYERRENSWKFMKWWLFSEENMLKWAEISHTLPALKSVMDDEIITEDPVLSVVAEAAPKYKMRPTVAGYYYIQTTVFNQEIPYYLKGDVTLDELIATMTAQSNKIIDDYKVGR